MAARKGDCCRRQLNVFVLLVVLLVCVTCRFIAFERQMRDGSGGQQHAFTVLSVKDGEEGAAGPRTNLVRAEHDMDLPETDNHNGVPPTVAGANTGEGADDGSQPVEHKWLSLKVGGDRLWVVGAYLRPTPRDQLMILGVYEGSILDTLQELEFILPSGGRVKASQAIEIRHVLNKAVLVTFPIATKEAREELMGDGGSRVEIGLAYSNKAEGRLDGLVVNHGPPSKGQQQAGQEAGSKRVVHCMGTLFGTVNVAMFIEWIEYYLALGVNHFHVYDSTVPEESKELYHVLMSYAAEGIISYHPWQGIGCLDDHTCLADTKIRYTYHAQDLAIHDCFLREEGSAQWLLFGDLDEVWVVEDGGTSGTTTQLLPPLEALHDAEPNLDAWILKKVWVITADQMPTVEDEENRQRPLLAQYTRKHLGAQGGVGGNGRVKYAIRVAHGDYKISLPMQVHEPGPEGEPRGYIKPRKGKDEGTGPNKAGVIMHFNHYETRRYSVTNHLRSPDAARPLEEVINPALLQSVARSLGISLVPIVSSNDQPAVSSDIRALSSAQRAAPELVRSVYRRWREVSASVAQSNSPFYLDPDKLGEPPCITCN